MPKTSVSEDVQEFYKANPYPSYGSAAKTKAAEAFKKYCTKPGRYLEAGCGTGHVVAGSAITLPHLEFHAIDFSDASLEIAKKVAQANNVNIEFRQANLMEPLPFDFKFDYISCLGVLHHLEDPPTGLANLADKLNAGGYIFIHVYGEDYHRRRFQIVELLDLISSEQDSHQTRYELYQSLERHELKNKRGSLIRRLARLSVRDVLLGVRNRLTRRNLGDSYSLQAWDGPWTDKMVSEKWLDQFAHPNERTYNLAELARFLNDAGLELVESFALGRLDNRLVPPEWAERMDNLDLNGKSRLMELLNLRPTSPFIAARKLPIHTE